MKKFEALVNVVRSRLSPFRRHVETNKSTSSSGTQLCVSMTLDENTICLKGGDDKITLTWNHSNRPDLISCDFAAFLFLPIAMARGQDLFIDGAGSPLTKANCEKASDAWSTLVPRQYRPVNVEFSGYTSEPERPDIQRDLMFFSGGIDSTHALLRRASEGLEQDLITLQGMDYKLEDRERFELANSKTNLLASQFCKVRHFVSVDAYKTYKKHGISAQLSHVFLLAATGFIYSGSYDRCVISADLSLEQQIKAFPVGSTFATNRYFDSGTFRLITEDENLTRAGKLPLISRSITALKAISFCKDYATRPENCGRCSKCVRTKIMFTAAVGYIPDEVFQDSSLDGQLGTMKLSKVEGINYVFLKDTYLTALRHGHLDKLPWLHSLLDDYSGA